MTTPPSDTDPPPSPSHTVVASYVDRYLTTTLTEQQWQRLAADVKALTLRAEPVSATDARTFMSTLCAFLEWSERMNGPQPLAAVLTTDQVGRHINNLKGQISDGGRSNAQGRLRRALRVLAGEPARTKRQPRSASAAPYESPEMTALANAAVHEPALGTVLTALGHREAAGGAPGPAAFTPPCPDSWPQARQAAAAAGVHLTLDRVRLTWVVRQLTTDGALATTLKRTTLTRADLESAKDHLHVADQDAYKAQLRQ